MTEVSCWIITGERQTAIIRSKYVQVLLNQDMSFFDTYGNNGDIVSQVFTDVFLIQSTLSEKVCPDISFSPLSILLTVRWYSSLAENINFESQSILILFSVKASIRFNELVALM